MVTNLSSQNGRNQPKPISTIVDKIVRSLGISGRYYGWSFVTAWPEIAGENIARISKAIKFEDGTLFIAVADDTWRQELSMGKESILEKIHALPHGRVIKKIQLVAGKKGNQH
ncbi:MAG: DUF721 domain-containing protein [bacterium]|nr:DUF721 domain-containing protein [bacterium]